MEFKVKFTKAELNNVRDALYECLAPNKRGKPIFQNHLKRNSACNALDKIRGALAHAPAKPEPEDAG